MKKVYLSIVYLTVKSFKFHCKKTVTLAFPRCGEVFVVTETESTTLMDSWADATGNSRRGFAGPNQDCLILLSSSRLFMHVWMNDRTRLLVTYLSPSACLITTVIVVNEVVPYRGQRLLTHRLSTLKLGHLGLFASCTLSHSPFRSLCLFGRNHNSLSPPPFFTSCS
jgi:hypothetical protein